MKNPITWILASIVAVALVFAAPRSSQAETDTASLKIAKAVKLYIAREHKKRRSDPSDDFNKIHKICGKAKSWTKGCRFWKPTSGKDEYMFQVRPGGKVYGVPSMFH